MAPANECIPYFEPGTRIPASVLTGKSVTGKRFVKIAGNAQSALDGLNELTDGGNIQIELCAAKDKAPLGVSSHDAAAGDKVTVLAGPMVVPVLAGEAIGAGEQVGIGAEGKAVKADAEHPAVGLCVSGCESGKNCPVKLYS